MKNVSRYVVANDIVLRFFIWLTGIIYNILWMPIAKLARFILGPLALPFFIVDMLLGFINKLFILLVYAIRYLISWIFLPIPTEMLKNILARIIIGNNKLDNFGARLHFKL